MRTYGSVNSMNLSWDDRRTRQFATNIGLITSNGSHGNNIMSAEWTHHISYSPSLIAINIHGFDATADNIIETKEFGVNIAAENQNVLCSVAGGSSGKAVDKIKVLEELGMEFYPANKINVLMVKGTAMNAECKVLKYETVGDHIMFIGEVLEISADENIKPIAYHNGRFWKLGDNIPKPPQEVLDNIKKMVEKHRKT